MLTSPAGTNIMCLIHMSPTKQENRKTGKQASQPAQPSRARSADQQATSWPSQLTQPASSARHPSRFTVFLFSCVPVFPLSRFPVFLFSGFPVFLFSCCSIFLIF